jgi:lipopolysaccharide export system permease protein
VIGPERFSIYRCADGKVGAASAVAKAVADGSSYVIEGSAAGSFSGGYSPLGGYLIVAYRLLPVLTAYCLQLTDNWLPITDHRSPINRQPIPSHPIPLWTTLFRRLSCRVLGIFDRYLLKSFIIPFSYSLCGMLGIWLVYDLGVNGPGFVEAHISGEVIALYYLVQIPYMLVNFTPLCVLLGLLYVLTRMSRRNEIISMLGAGRSVPRVLWPLFFFGIVVSGICTYLNFELAPKGYYAENYMIDEVSKGRSKTTLLDGHIFVNRREHRIWFVQHLKTKTQEMQGIEVTQQDAQETIVSIAYAESASHNRLTGVWTLFNGKITQVDPEGNVTDEEFFDRTEIKGWSETPWQIGSSALKGKMMTVPELQRYLRINADFPPTVLADYRSQFWYRFALPWNSMIVILVASPMCVVFSRRGALGGVAGGLLLFIALFAAGNVCMALGAGARIPPIAAAWTPIVLFLAVGLYLVFLRSTNRPIPFLG